MAQPPVPVAIVSTDPRDRAAFEHAAAEAGVQVTCSTCTTIEELEAAHGRTTLALIVCWHERSPIDRDTLRRWLDRAAERPPLLLAADRIGSRDYVRARGLNAEDVIDCDHIARLEFVLRRALHHLGLRRRLDAARRQLESTQVVDAEAFTTPDDPATMPPLVETIDQALRTDALHLVFQPIVATHEEPDELYEAFVRIRGETADIMPDEFLPVATRYGLLPAIDRWVVRNAVERFIAERDRRGRHGNPLHFMLNVSAHTLVEERAAESLLKMIGRARPRAGSFVIKLDKNTVLSRLALAKSLNRLAKKVGLKFAIDHYEASDTHLNFLDHVSVDYIKLHGSLIDGIDRDPAKCRQVEKVIATGRRHGIRVIAGQVEYVNELATLYRIGVDYVQGYLIGAPGEAVEPSMGATEIVG